MNCLSNITQFQARDLMYTTPKSRAEMTRRTSARTFSVAMCAALAGMIWTDLALAIV